MKINIVLPVLDEEEVLASSIDSLLYFCSLYDIDALVSIVDNGSSDATYAIAKTLAKKHENIEVLKTPRRGVGLALATAIEHNDKRSHPCYVIGYMDIDLATRLDALVSVRDAFVGGAEVVVGSRLLPTSCVRGRSLKREIASRALNLIVKASFYGINEAGFSDAMCGFKFYHHRVASLLNKEALRSDGWFYCAQMLLLSCALKIEIVEIPIVWEDDASTKVRILPLALSYLREIYRIRRHLVANKEHLASISASWRSKHPISSKDNKDLAKPLRCILIGHGYFGRIIERYILASPSLTLAHIFTSRDRLDSHTLRALAREEGIEAAFIIVPLAMHQQMIDLALDARLKVFVEKPTVATLLGYENIMAQGLLVYTDYIYTVSPSVRALRWLYQRHIAASPIKEVQLVASIGQYGKFYDGESVFEVLGVHLLSCALFILECQLCLSHVSFSDDANTMELSLKAKGQIEARVGIKASLLSKKRSRSIALICDGLNLEFDPLASYTLRGKVGTTIINERYNESDNVKNALAAFLSCIDEPAIYERHIALCSSVMELYEEIKSTSGIKQTSLAKSPSAPKSV